MVPHGTMVLVPDDIIVWVPCGSKVLVSNGIMALPMNLLFEEILLVCEFKIFHDNSAIFVLVFSLKFDKIS